VKSTPFARFALWLSFVPVVLLFPLHPVHAGNATWNLNPTTGDWNTPANWTPNTVPGDSDIAAFGTSNITNVTFSEESGVLEMLFNPGASSHRQAAEAADLAARFRLRDWRAAHCLTQMQACMALGLPLDQPCATTGT